ncbi:hypothetical protein FD755_013545 [Muntiacus reevesi]|uniref:K Homology domain-containing protein n=1 Tax=Muntiacus reevesi TaxID=9886 RepID=A0A5N3XPR5_MUNRE|nr:hypothetical protein FD755_013545 [Muntiacus reevesi]
MEEEKYLPELTAERDSLDPSFVHALRSDGKNEDEEERYLDVISNKNIKLSERVLIPVKQYPKFNFMGKLLGPRGNSLKRLQEETGAKMSILGKGSMRDKAKIDTEPLLENTSVFIFGTLKMELNIHFLFVFMFLFEISPEYSLEGPMLKLKLQYFGHLMRRSDSLEKTPKLGKTEGRRRRGRQRMRWLDGITNSTAVKYLSGYPFPFSRGTSQPRDQTLHARHPCPSPTPGIYSNSCPLSQWPKYWSFSFSINLLEESMATHSSILAWRIPRTGEPSGLQSTEQQRVGQD